MDAYIGYLNFHHPKETITIADVLDDAGLTEQELENLSMRLLGMVVPKETLSQSLVPMSTMFFGDRAREGSLYVGMAERMFQSAGIRPEDVSHIIYTRGNSIAVGDPWTIRLDETCVNVPYFVQRRTGMNRAVVFNVEQECTGSFTAVNIARALVREGEARNVLILSSNYFGMSHRRLMGGSIFVGDGQGLMLVGRDGGPFRVVDATGHTDGAIDSVNSFLDPGNQQQVIEVGVETIRALLERNRLDATDLSLIIPLNTSQFAWIEYTKSLGIPIGKVFLDNMGKGGHLGDVDLVRNLKDVAANGGAPEGYVIAYGVSTGTSWNALLLQRTRG